MSQFDFRDTLILEFGRIFLIRNTAGSIYGRVFTSRKVARDTARSRSIQQSGAIKSDRYPIIPEPDPFRDWQPLDAGRLPKGTRVSA